MDPVIWAAIISGVVSLVSKMSQSGQPQYNDPTQAWIDQYNGGSRDINREKSSALWSALTGGGNLDPNTWLQQMQNALGGAQGYMDAAAQYAANYNPQAGFNAFRQANPYLQQNALDFAQQAVNPFGSDVRALAESEANQGVANLANQFAGSGALGTGAGMAAMANAAVNPRLQALTQISQMQGNLAHSLYGNLAPNVLGGFNQGYATQAQTGIDAARAAIQSILSQAGLYQSAANPLLALLGQEGASTFLAPQFTQNPNYMSDADIFGMGSNVFGGLSSILGSNQSSGGSLGSYGWPSTGANMYAPVSTGYGVVPSMGGGLDMGFVNPYFGLK